MANSNSNSNSNPNSNSTPLNPRPRTLTALPSTAFQFTPSALPDAHPSHPIQFTPSSPSLLSPNLSSLCPSQKPTPPLHPPFFGPGSKRLSLSDSLANSPLSNLPTARQPPQVNANIMLTHPISISRPGSGSGSGSAIDPMALAPNPALQTPPTISPSSDDSSDDDDEAIADALLGRSLQPKLLIGRIPHLQVPPRISKEDGELSEEDPSRMSPRSAPLLTRLDHEPLSQQLPPKPSSATSQAYLAHLLSLPDRPNIPTGPRRQVRPNSSNLLDHSDRPHNPYQYSHSDSAHPPHPISTHPSSDVANVHRIAYHRPSNSPSQSFSCSANSLTSTGRSSMDSIDKLIHVMSQPDSSNPSGQVPPSANPDCRSSTQHHPVDNARNTNAQPDLKPLNLQISSPLSDRIHSSSGVSKDASLDTPDPRRAPDGKLIAHDHALLARIGTQSDKTDRDPPHLPAISSEILPGSFGLRDRLLSPNSASLFSASSSGRSLLERTYHPPPPPPPPPAPEGWSESFVPQGSRRNERAQFGDRGMMSSRGTNDRRRAPYIPQHPRRYCASRSRSPPRRNRYSPPPSSAGSRGPASISPHAKFFRRRTSRSPPPVPRRKSPSRARGDLRTKRPYRKTSPAPYFSNNRRNLRDGGGSPPKSSNPQFGHHHNHRRNSHMPVSNSAGGFNSHYHNQAEAETMNSSVLDSTLDVQSGEIPKVSVLIANLPSHPTLTPKALYQHSIQSLYSDKSHPALPFELTLYRFAGTTRVCGELKFTTEPHARHFANKAPRSWPAHWYASIPPPPNHAEQSMEFTVVERDRTPWPSRHDTFNPSVSMDCAPVDDVPPINATTDVQADQPDSQKEVGPPTPTSFNSQAPPSRSPLNATSLTPGFATACALHHSPTPLAADGLANPPGLNQAQSGHELTGVLLSDLKACVSMSVLQGHFVVPTRPRHFRMFEPLKVTHGAFTVKGNQQPVQAVAPRSGCLIAFEDAYTASNFSRVLQDNAPFQPMRIELVNVQDIEFSPTASIISSEPDRMRGGAVGQYQHGNPERDNYSHEPHWPSYRSSSPALSPTMMEISRIVEMAEQQQSFRPSGLSHGEMGCFGGGGYADQYQMSMYGSVPPSPLLFNGVYPQQAGWPTGGPSAGGGTMGEGQMAGLHPCRADQLRQALLARRAGQNVYHQDR